MEQNGMKWLAPSACAAFVLAMASNVAAQNITEARISELIREAASRAGVTETTASAPASAQTAAGQGDRPVVALSLDDAIKLALDRNLDISVQRLNPQTFDYSLASLQAVYKPTLTSTVAHQSQTNPSTQTTSGGQVGTGVLQDTTTFNGGLSQNLPWGGGTITGTINNNRGTTTSTTALFNPNYNNNWSAALYAAAAPELQDRQHTAADPRDEAEPGHLGNPASGDHHQHAVERPERLLGLRVRGAVGRGRAPVRRARRTARLGQPDAGRGRDDGADRRRSRRSRRRRRSVRIWRSPRARAGPTSSS